ncbi:MAG: scyllo-inosose 3-dehydrogenase [Candidatus Choladocola sp.]|nr:scyllo-inosose 3-dehydrogenase [Candidatus Choladocola sp.]
MKETMKAVVANGQWQPRMGYVPTEREIKDRRAVLGSQIFYNPSLKLMDVQVPVPEEDEVLLKVGGCAVCGSDTAFLGADPQGYSRYAGHCKLPCTIGHEFSGEVAAVGEKVKLLKKGDLVVAETMNWCGECRACRRGLFNQCENLEEIGFTKNGAYAEYLVVKEKYCFKVNNLVDVYGDKNKALEVAAMVEPLAVVYNGMFVRGGGFAPGGHVVIFGGGPIGLSAVTLAKATGAAEIIVFEPKLQRQKIAKKLGATWVLDPIRLLKTGIHPAQKVLEITKNVGAAMVIESTNRQQDNIPEAVRMLMAGGKIVQIGITSDDVAFLPVYLQKTGVDFRFSMGSSGHGIWQNVIRLIESRRIDPLQYLSGTYGMERAINAIKSTARGNDGKYVVTPNW